MDTDISHYFALFENPSQIRLLEPNKTLVFHIRRASV